MKEQLKKLKEKFLKDMHGIDNSGEFRELEIKYLGRKGEMTKILKGLSDLSLEEKKDIGKLANEIKIELENVLKSAVNKIKQKENKELLKKELIDVSQPVIGEEECGKLHPLTKVQHEIEDIFTSMGFMVLDGPELESEYYNCEALNIPSWHPARDMQDTFYVESSVVHVKEPNRLLLRSHTSPVQIRAMQKYGAPIRLIVPGKVFRYEATDATHDSNFHQVEGLMIGANISISNLIAVSREFLAKIFNKEINIRVRPGYFPFVEPGMEMDLECIFCNGKGCKICKKSGWMEFMGAGMVHPNVLKYGGIDSDKYQGFAFGFGITRLVMLKYEIDDIRLLLGGDLRFLKQF